MNNKLKRFNVIILSAILCLITCLAFFGINAVIASNDNAEKDSIEQLFEYSDDITGVEEDFDFSVKQPYNECKSPMGESKKGFAIYTKTSGASFTYSKEINFYALTKDFPLIEVFALYGSEYSVMSDLTITFYDAKDEGNTFNVTFYESTESNHAIYARANYNGRSIGISNEAHNKGKPSEGMYGTVCYTQGYVGPDSMRGQYGSVSPFAVSYDYEENAIYSYGSQGGSSTKYLILDLDDPRIFNEKTKFKGFENGLGKMKVSFSLDSARTGGVVVKSIMGGVLEEALKTADDYPTPNIFVYRDAQYREQMPKCGVGDSYKIPDVYASDWFYGKIDNVTTSLFLQDEHGNYTIDKSNLISNGCIVPDVIGNYRIIYTANNGKKTATEVLDVEVIDELPTLTVALERPFEKPMVLESLYIPKTYVYGGNGVLVKQESLFYNGVQIDIPSNRKIFIDKTGYVSLRVEVEGYSGLPLVRYFTVEVKDMTALQVSGMPLVVEYNKQVKFPKAIAYNTATNESVLTTVTVDGTVLDESLLYTVTKQSGSISVNYSAGERSYDYTIPVVDLTGSDLKPTMYMVAENNAQLKDSNQGLIVSCSRSNATAYWGFPIVTGAASQTGSITLKTLDGSTDFEYVDVVLTDYYDSASSCFIRVYTNGDDTNQETYVQFNGEGEKVLVTGSINNKFAKSLSLLFDTNAGYIYDGYTEQNVLQIVGYTAKVSKVALRFGNVTGRAGVCVASIANQNLSYSADREWRDKAGAVASYDFALNKNLYVDIGSVIRIPQASAYDVRTGFADVSVKVVDPEGKAVTVENNSFIASKFGAYLVTYTTYDANDVKFDDKYYVNTVDTVSPTLNIEKLIKSELKVGTKVVIPNATATDNIDSSCNVFVYINFAIDFNQENVQMGQEYCFDRVGEYTINYVTHDSCYNYTRYVIKINVTKE